MRLRFIVAILYGILTIPASAQSQKKDSVYFGKDVTTKPEFPGGPTAMQQFIQGNIQYPADALTAGTTGRVFIGFIVNKDGVLSEIKVNKSLSAGLDTAAIQLVRKMPPWKPATKDGTAVRCRMGMPISFGGTAVEMGPDSARRIVDVKPEFPGGIDAMVKYIQATLKYPVLAKRQNLEGKSFIEIVVEKNGTFSSAKIIKSSWPMLDEEALRVVKAMPAWTPGHKDGKIVRAKWVIPIFFRLSK